MLKSIAISLLLTVTQVSVFSRVTITYCLSDLSFGIFIKLTKDGQKVVSWKLKMSDKNEK